MQKKTQHLCVATSSINAPGRKKNGSGKKCFFLFYLVPSWFAKQVGKLDQILLRKTWELET